MNLDIKSPDPFHILAGTKYVIENSSNVSIVPKNIKDLITAVSNTIDKGLENPSVSFGSRGSWENDTQLILVEDSVNFCFWAEKDKEKWSVEYPEGKENIGGWYALVACFKRALDKDLPLLDAFYLSEMSLMDTKALFLGNGKTQIPLIKERKENLNEIGKNLLSKYEGKFSNLIEDSNGDFVRLVNLVLENFPSFRDQARYKGKMINFYKRAQIVASDISYLKRYDKRSDLENINSLTAFADYKLPQIFRHYGVLEYAKDLSEKIDDFVLLKKGSDEEIEIRAATIWSVELIRQEIPKYTSAQIDNAIWHISQDQSKMDKPYHRTYTIYY